MEYIGGPLDGMQNLASHPKDYVSVPLIGNGRNADYRKRKREDGKTVYEFVGYSDTYGGSDE